MSRFAVEYRSIGLLPTCVGNERIRIEADGAVLHAKNVRECEEGQVWSAEWRQVGELGSALVTALRAALERGELAALPALSCDETAEGGRRQELRIELDESVYERAVENCEPPAFGEIVRLVWGALAQAKLR